MKEMSMRWRSFLARLAVTAAVLGVVIFAAVRGAMARPGTPGGAARSFVTIAGTVTGVPPGVTTMQFTFRRQVAGDAGVVSVACERTVVAMVEPTGEFAAEVPLDPFTTQCPETMFDGRDVTVDVAVNGVPVVDGGAVNPVPYALHASIASAAAPDSGLERQLSTAAVSVPPGTIVAFGGERIPDGWLLCDGREVMQSAYPALFSAIGTAWGAGAGMGTFRLPDLRGRVALGRDNMGGTAARRITESSIGGTNAGTLGGSGGEEAHRLTIAEMPSHTHVYTRWGGLGRVTSGGSPDIWQGQTPAGVTAPEGGGASHSVTQPWAAVNFIIRN